MSPKKKGSALKAKAQPTKRTVRERPLGPPSICDPSDAIFARDLNESVAELVETMRRSNELLVQERVLTEKVRKNVQDIQKKSSQKNRNIRNLREIVQSQQKQINAQQLQLAAIHQEREATERKASLEKKEVRVKLQKPRSYIKRVFVCMAREASLQFAKAAMALYVPQLLNTPLPRMIVDGSVIVAVKTALKTPLKLVNPNPAEKNPFA